MIITGKLETPQKEIEKLRLDLEKEGFKLQKVLDDNQLVFGIIGDTTKLDESKIKAYEWVTTCTRISTPYKLVSRAFKKEDTVIDVNGIKIGGNNPVVYIGGPCAVENEEQLLSIAKDVKDAGGVILRGGAFKPRTSPYSFQGLGQEGIELLKLARSKYHLPIISEILSINDIDLFVKNVDIIQVGARNMQNYDLLKALGKINKPVMLKRGFGNTINEWLLSAEYILAGGNKNVILCERGIRSFETETRNTLDIATIGVVKELTHLPIIIDPSHATGRFELVESVSLAAVAAGADGLIIEVHNHPECAMSDGAQSLKPERFKNLIVKGKAIEQIVRK